ncbi:MAG: hypothetical protein L0177_01095 [Chloroflexi bacterium]|nr:hypothetical protein [Chloroflexota bacterium]
MFSYRKLGDFTYNLIEDKAAIRPFLLKWIGREWEIDQREFPDQPWTKDWLDWLQRMDFEVAIVGLDEIKPREDLMAHRTESYDFMEELRARATEREESMLRGISIEPLLVRKDTMELMDGYTRYMVLKNHRQQRVYAYLGTLRSLPM